MLKLGITSTRGLGRASRWLGRERHASFLLLEALARDGADAAAYDTLVARVRLPNGTWRQTAAGRLRRVDEALLAALERTHATASALSVLDLGVSTGVTSAELYDALSTRWSVDFTASDLYRDAFAVSAPRGGWTVVLDAGGSVLQHVVGPFVLPGQIEEAPVYAANRALKRWSERALVPRARRALASDAGAATRPYFERARAGRGLVVQRLPFFSWRCLELCRSTPGFRFATHDVTKPLGARATVVRALNLVISDYFDAATAAAAIAHLVEAVEPGGYLVAGQSRGLDPGAVRATVFRIDRGAADVVARLGEGYEFEPAVQRAAGGTSWKRACEA